MMKVPTFYRNKPNIAIAPTRESGAFDIQNADGSVDLLYAPQPKQKLYHASTVPNLIMEGRRGTGKSVAIRWDFHMRALAYPGFTYLILRRTMPELRKSHLLFIQREMERISQIPGYSAATYLKGVSETHYGNGSVGLFGHCETEADIEKYLGGQFCAIAFDEITTFDWEMVTKISTSCRVEEGSGLIAIVRGGTNPLGVSAEEVHRYFIAKDVHPGEDPDYNPEDWSHIKLVKDDNKYLDYDQYDRRFASLSAAYRAAWLDGTWGVEGAYFNIDAPNLVKDIPTYTLNGITRPAHEWEWMQIYRVIDWGFHPDPAVCIWIVVMPDGREIPFMERAWIRTTTQEVARQIAELSEGMRIVTTFADPTMWDGEKDMGHCLADEFETRGVPLTQSVNDRTAAGRAIQEHLNQTLKDGKPRMQLYEDAQYGVPDTVRSLRAMRIDKKKPGRIADHKHDHHTVCLGYFCMAGVPPSQVPDQSRLKRWMQPTAKRRILGSSGVRSAYR